MYYVNLSSKLKLSKYNLTFTNFSNFTFISSSLFMKLRVEVSVVYSSIFTRYKLKRIKKRRQNEYFVSE
jgi:hypothetical protein